MGILTRWLETPEQRAQRLAEEADWHAGNAAGERFERERARGLPGTRWLDGS